VKHPLSKAIMPLVRLMKRHGEFVWEEREEIARAIEETTKAYDMLKIVDRAQVEYQRPIEVASILDGGDNSGKPW